MSNEIKRVIRWQYRAHEFESREKVVDYAEDTFFRTLRATLTKENINLRGAEVYKIAQVMLKNRWELIDLLSFKIEDENDNDSN